MKKEANNKTEIGLILISGATLLIPGFMNFKRMRLMATDKLSAPECLGMFFWVVVALTVLMLALAIINKPKAYIAIEGISLFMLVTLFFLESEALATIPDAESYSRLSFGVGMWLWMASIACILIKVSEKTGNKMFLRVFLAAALIVTGVLFATGNLEGLAVVKEYHSSNDMYIQNLLQHIKITIFVMIAGIAIGIPLGYWVHRSERAEKVIFSVINITETLPGISFIALLMIPFAYLSTNFPELRKFGIVQFGAGPAAVALTFYAIFPIVHYTRAGLKMVGDSHIEVARAVGMKERSILFRIMVPIALPEIMNGIRIASVYTVTGVSLAAMCGGGGMGKYMLNGESLDAVLLGAIPVIAMAFILDKGILWITRKYTHRRTAESV